MLWRDMICNRKQCVHTIGLINKIKSIESENIISLCMLRRHYINCTICACHISHIMKLFIPDTFYYNSPYWQTYV